MSLLAPWIAVFIFLLMFILIILDRIEHHYVTLSCALATLVIVFGLCLRSMEAVTATLDIGSMFKPEFWYSPALEAEESTGINWATIIFIAGMMVMVEGMALNGFFHWLCLKIARLVHYKPQLIFLAFMFMSAFLAMFIDSITVILFLAAVSVELAKLLKFNPVGMILAEIFCANLGGSATMCGDPPNIIIGTSLGLTFFDFVTNTGVIAAVSLILAVIYFWLIFHKELERAGQGVIDPASLPNPADSIRSKTGFITSILIFLCAIVMLVSHSETGLSVAFIGAFIALVTMLAAGRDVPKILKKVDYKTLLFFIGLFVVVGGLEQTGVLEMAAQFIGHISGGNPVLIIVIIIWVSAIASAFVDNIPFSATMIPVIRAISLAHGMDISTLAWSLAVATDIGGCATPIGASANVVGTAVAIKNGYPVGWGRYCKACIPATILVMIAGTLMVLVRYGFI